MKEWHFETWEDYNDFRKAVEDPVNGERNLFQLMTSEGLLPGDTVKVVCDEYERGINHDTR